MEFFTTLEIAVSVQQLPDEKGSHEVYNIVRPGTANSKVSLQKQSFYILHPFCLPKTFKHSH